MIVHAMLTLALANPIAMLQAAQPPVDRSLRAPAPSTVVATTSGVTSTAPQKHTTFGVGIAPVSDAVRALQFLNADEGVVATTVESGGAAEAAGLHAGDLMLAISGKRVDETTFYQTLRAQPRGRAFRVEFVREGKWRDTWVTIDQ
jgi:S1-C subfamily serine protease